MTMGAANAIGRFITRLTSLPQKPFSTSARVLVFWVFSASQFSHHTVGLRTSGLMLAADSTRMVPATNTAMAINSQKIPVPRVSFAENRPTKIHANEPT